MKRIRLAVRALVETVMRGGDIDGRYTDASLMMEGARAHRLLQSSMGGDYAKEVSLKIDVEAEGIPLRIHGRADGVFHEEDTLVIDEIKTTSAPLSRVFDKGELHLGQAKCYAHMLLTSLGGEAPDNIALQLTYYQLETAEIERRRFSYTREALAAFFEDLLVRYSRFLRFERDWRLLRDESIAALPFPFPAYRKGQREMAVAAYSAIGQEKRLYVQAPTGTGKTLSALFPSIKALKEEKAQKLFYLTAKTVTRAVAEEAVRLMREKGLRLKSVTMRAKDKLCFLEEPACNPEDCPYARGHFDRVNDAILSLIEAEDIITPELVTAHARRHRVCPHEFMLDLTEWADLVVCDYNHVFDPRVYLHRYFAAPNGSFVFLIDEAHNLYDRVRDMYTAALEKTSFMRLARQLKDKPALKLKKSMVAIDRYMLTKRKQMEGSALVEKELDEAFSEHLNGFVREAEVFLAQRREHSLHKEILALYFEVTAFLGIAGGYDEAYTSITETREGDVRRTLFCLDPSRVIAQKLSYARACVLFSATLTPLPYYREILGGGDTDGMLSLPSPFQEERLLLMLHAGISTRYADRARSVQPIVEAIQAVVSKKKGNYIVYFPSYDYMREVHAALTAISPDINTLMQKSAMDEEARKAFLLRFDAKNREGMLGFCVLGGIFSEGIDLVGERLIGVIIVGVGLPKLSLRQNLIREYFEDLNGMGYLYAYVYPGINKVLQAAGRVIRSEDDYGLALLIDSRFNTALYRGLFPPHWAGIKTVWDKKEALGLLNAFAYLDQPKSEVTDRDSLQTSPAPAVTERAGPPA